MMKASVLTALLTCAPALVVAQQASTSAAASAQANTQTSVTVPSSYTADAHAKIDAAFQAAKAKNLPDQPMRQRLAEGQAKGAGEAQVVAAVQGVESRMEASQAAMIRAGRTQPQQSEVAAGAQAMERGASSAQVEALVKHAPADRSLTVAFNVLAKLEANGQPVDNALAKVASKLDAGANDDAVVSLVGGLGAGQGNAAAAGSSAANGKGVTAGVTGAVTGAVSGVVGGKKP